LTNAAISVGVSCIGNGRCAKAAMETNNKENKM
jgi:hypothetical protein